MTSKLSFALLSTFALLCACSAELAPSSPSSGEVVDLTVVCGEPSTKTYIEQDGTKYLPYWNDADKLEVLADFADKTYHVSEIANINETGKIAMFNGNISIGTGSAHTLNCIYPSSSYDEYYTDGDIGVKLPSAQYPAVSSFDPSADILVSKPYVLNASESSVQINDMQFARVMGILKIFPKNAAAGDKIQRLDLTSSCDLAGRARVDVNDGDIESWAYGGKTVSALYSNNQPVLGTDAVYLMVKPQTIASGETLSFEIYTDNHKITKTVNIGKDIVIIAGNVTVINLSLTESNCMAWNGYEKTDVLKASVFSANSTTYEAFNGVPGVSGAKYTGETANNNAAIQITADNKTRGIVSTVSGGEVAKVEVEWNSSTADERTLNIYGSNTPYASASDLYDSGKEPIGTIRKGESTFEFKDVRYKYVGIRSSANAIYLDKVSITWNTNPVPTCEAPVIVCKDNEVTITSATEGASIYYTTDGSEPTSFSTLYCGSFDVSGTITIKAIAVKEGYNNSPVSSRTTGDSYVEPALEQPWLELPAALALMPSNYHCYTHRAAMNGESQRNYSLLYDSDKYTSYWVAYPLCSAHMGTIKREDAWEYDDMLSEDLQTKVTKGYGAKLSTANYSNNYYARGHQIPNADRNGVADMQVQTFVSTNSTPQLQYGFNGEIWKNLEEAVRDVAKATDTVYVVTGAAFSKNGASPTTINITNVNDGKSLQVPNYYWKVLLKVKRDGGTITSACAIGFWMPHSDLKGKSYASDDYVFSVSDIESWTGFDFFANLGNLAGESVESTAESNTSWSDFCSF